MISSHPEWTDYKEAPIHGNWFMRWLKSRFRFVDYPFLMAYRGFGNGDELVIQGHVFRGMALSKPRRRYSAWKNFVALIKMFLIRTVEGAVVEMEVGGERHKVTSGADGFFEFTVTNHGLPTGWHAADMRLADEIVEGQEEVALESEIFIGSQFPHGCISDIDDTFLVSHVTRAWRKFYLLLTKNSETRKPFKGVVDFYRALETGTSQGESPFFYVSSSEWNLYEFLIKFMKFHKLPKGVLQLKQIKDQLTDFFKSGYGSHQHKGDKIERILKLFPESSFVLLGDNGQHDPYIYQKIAEKYPDRVKAVYIRGVKRSHRSSTQEVVDGLQRKGIPALQFKRSADAVEHARQNGLIA